MKITDENLRQKSQTKILCVIRNKDDFAIKQCMLGVKKIKQLKRVICNKADFATKQHMLGVKIFVQNEDFCGTFCATLAPPNPPGTSWHHPAPSWIPAH